MKTKLRLLTLTAISNCLFNIQAPNCFTLKFLALLSSPSELARMWNWAVVEVSHESNIQLLPADYADCSEQASIKDLEPRRQRWEWVPLPVAAATAASSETASLLLQWEGNFAGLPNCEGQPPCGASQLFKSSRRVRYSIAAHPHPLASLHNVVKTKLKSCRQKALLVTTECLDMVFQWAWEWLAGYAVRGYNMVLGAASAVTAPTASSLNWLRSRAGELPLGVAGVSYSRNPKTGSHPNFEIRKEQKPCDVGKQKDRSLPSREVWRPTESHPNQAKQLSVALQEAEHVSAGTEEISDLPQSDQESAQKAADHQRHSQSNPELRGAEMAESHGQDLDSKDEGTKQMSDHDLQEGGSGTAKIIPEYQSPNLPDNRQLEIGTAQNEQLEALARRSESITASLQGDERSDDSIQDPEGIKASGAQESFNPTAGERGQCRLTHDSL